MQETERPTTSRRSFLEKIFAATVMTVAAPSLVLGRIVPTLRTTAGGALAGRYRVDLSQSAHAPLRTVGGSMMLARITGLNYRIIVTRTGESTFAAVNATCTHLGSTVRAVSSTSNGLLVCPSHDSAFAPDGAVRRGPATRPLQSFETFFDGGNILEIEIDEIAAAPVDAELGAWVGTPYVGADATRLTLDLALERSTAVTAAVYSTSGELRTRLFSGRLGAGAHEVAGEIADLAAGAYMVVVELEGRTLISRRFVVAR